MWKLSENRLYYCYINVKENLEQLKHLHKLIVYASIDACCPKHKNMCGSGKPGPSTTAYNNGQSNANKLPNFSCK